MRIILALLVATFMASASFAQCPSEGKKKTDKKTQSCGCEKSGDCKCGEKCDCKKTK